VPPGTGRHLRRFHLPIVVADDRTDRFTRLVGIRGLKGSGTRTRWMKLVLWVVAVVAGVGAVVVGYEPSASTDLYVDVVVPQPSLAPAWDLPRGVAPMPDGHRWIHRGPAHPTRTP
jgi:hypothetical protein